MKRGEQGFTLMELVVAMAVAGVIFGVIGMGLYHLVSVPDYGNEKLTALHELQNAGHWFSRDGQMAENAVPAGSKLTLSYPDDPAVVYNLLDGSLVRECDGASSVLARHVDDVLFSVAGSVVTMQLTTAPDGRWNVSENETYRVCLRVDNA